MVNKIEEKLSELMNIISEKDYELFIENNKLLKIYDLVMDLDENENILTNDVLEKIYHLVEEKLNSNK